MIVCAICCSDAAYQGPTILAERIATNMRYLGGACMMQVQGRLRRVCVECLMRFDVGYSEQDIHFHHVRACGFCQSCMSRYRAPEAQLA